MRSFNDYFRNKNVLIWGLGISGGGIGAVKFFLKNGAKVTVTDLKEENEFSNKIISALKKKGVGFVFGRHRSEDFLKADMIIKNPAIPKSSPYLKLCETFGLILESDISLFFKLFNGDIIGITGTKGKTTTASLLHLFFKKSGKKYFLAGNLGESVLNYLDDRKKWTGGILELSSFGLESLQKIKSSPHAAVFLNIFSDHLNRYDDFGEYFESKKNIYKFQKKGDYLILNYDVPMLRHAAKKSSATTLFYSLKKTPTKKNNFIATYEKRGVIYFKKDRIIKISDIKLKSHHAIENIMAAVTIAKLYNIKNEDIRDILKRFNGISGRFEKLGIIGDNITVINDTCATNPTACEMNIKAVLHEYSKKPRLIAGGVDKNMDFINLAKTIKNKVGKAYFIPGSATDKLISELIKIKFTSFYKYGNLQTAFEGALSESATGDIIMLSPAAASFNMFKNENDRGKQFINIFQKAKIKHPHF